MAKAKRLMTEIAADLKRAGVERITHDADGVIVFHAGPEGDRERRGQAQPPADHNGGDGALRSLVARIERLEEEKKAFACDIREVYAEAKAHGYDPKIIRKVIALRARDLNERLNEAALIESYLNAVGVKA